MIASRDEDTVALSVCLSVCQPSSSKDLVLCNGCIPPQPIRESLLLLHLLSFLVLDSFVFPQLLSSGWTISSFLWEISWAKEKRRRSLTQLLL